MIFLYQGIFDKSSGTMSNICFDLVYIGIANVESACMRVFSTRGVLLEDTSVKSTGV